MNPVSVERSALADIAMPLLFVLIWSTGLSSPGSGCRMRRH